ncbi:MAG: hypothetical protein ACLGIO_09085 [Acidimicrobiia bacterium]
MIAPVQARPEAPAAPAFDWCVGCAERPAAAGGVVCEPCWYSEPPDFTVVTVFRDTYLLQHRRAS